MNQWEQQFAEQMEALCAQSTSCFSHFAEHVLEPAFEAVSSFVERWHYETSTPSCEQGRRAFRFGLTEDAYVLVWFRLDGLDMLECEYEYGLPQHGRVSGVRTTGSLRSADEQWARSCFQMALSNFVTKFLEAGNRQHTPEMAMA